jgi:hypothetical protein
MRLGWIESPESPSDSIQRCCCTCHQPDACRISCRQRSDRVRDPGSGDGHFTNGCADDDRDGKRDHSGMVAPNGRPQLAVATPRIPR